MNRLINLSCLLIFTSLSVFAQKSRMLTSGVLIVDSKFSAISILNQDKSQYLKITRSKGGEFYLGYTAKYIPGKTIRNAVIKYYPSYYREYKKYQAPLPAVAIRAFYPDYSILVLDSKKISNGYYQVFVNGRWKKIAKGGSLQYKEWGTFMKQVYVTPNKSNPVYSEKSTNSTVIDMTLDHSFRIIQVSKEWIQVECSEECEGCPKDGRIRGWLKWKQDNELLIDIYYAC